MIGLDTNVVLRLVIDDGGDQPGRAHALVAERCTPKQPGYVAAVTMVELAWVLQSSFERTKAQTIVIFDAILDLSDVVVEAVIPPALHQWRASKADFADHVIALSAATAGYSETATFDKFAAQAPGFIPVP